MRNGIWAMFAVLALVVFVAPALAPYDPGRQFGGYEYAPPMRPHLIDPDWGLRAPFAFPIRLVDRLERRYAADRTRRVTSFTDAEDAEPWFLLGSDSFGRDILSRLAVGARLSLGMALLSALFAIGIGTLVGGAAGYAGGWADAALMRVADVVIVLPGIYVVLALRGVLPLVLAPAEVLAFVGWPSVARGVRGIVVIERESEYAEAAHALGAGFWRVLTRHLLPACRGFLLVQATVLVPAFLMAEATLSFVGLGFAAPTPSWGVMLRDAAAVQVVADAPWLLAPAAAIVGTVLGVHSVSHTRNRDLTTVISTQVT